MVSVVIPTYNRYEMLKLALKSVYTQSFLPKDVIVVDDGSTDNTKNIKKDFPDIRYIYKENGGVSSARNIGIKSAKYDLVCFLDSDDLWDKDKLKKQIDFHKKNNVLVSYTDEIWIRDNKEINIPKKFFKRGEDSFLENIEYCNIAPSSVCIEKKIFNEIGFFDEKLEVCEDYDMWLRISLRYNISLLNEKLIFKYAGHDDQLSFKYWGMDRFRVVALEKLIDSEKKDIIKQTLLKKYNLLLKGAIKYDKIASVCEYKQKLKEISKL